MGKISSIVLYVLAGISIILAGMFFLGEKATIFGTENVPVHYDKNLLWAAVLLVLTVLTTIFFSIEYLVTHPKALKGAGITIGVGAVLVLIAYALASDAYVPGLIEEVDTTPTTLKWVDVGLYVTYILGGIAILGMIASEIYRALK